jgi:hypothetical protein
LPFHLLIQVDLSCGLETNNLEGEEAEGVQEVEVPAYPDSDDDRDHSIQNSDSLRIRIMTAEPFH